MALLGEFMNKYIFNARDIAAYMKWFNVPNYLEVTYMQYFFSVGKKILAEPLTRDFEKFKNEVYRELYYLWANGFEDDRSDISKMPASGAVSLICDQECINLESYMKLITLHLIFSRYLPYVKINFSGIPFSLGIKCDFDVYEKNVCKVFYGLNLTCTDTFGKPFDIELGVPDELLCVSLNSSFKKKISGEKDFRMLIRNAEMKHMQELKEKSLEIFGSMNKEIKQVKEKVSRRPSSVSEKASKTSVKTQGTRRAPDSKNASISGRSHAVSLNAEPLHNRNMKLPKGAPLNKKRDGCEQT